MPGPSPAMMMTVSAFEGNADQSKSAAAKAAKEADQASDDLGSASQSAADYGKKIRDSVLGFIGDTAKGVVRPVLMPLQTIGRAGNTASMNALAKSLPGVVRKAVPPLKAEIEVALRKFHDLGDASELLPENLRDKLALRIVLADEFAGQAAESIFEDFSIKLSNTAKAVAVGDLQSRKVVDDDPTAIERAQEAAEAAAAAAAGVPIRKKKASAEARAAAPAADGAAASDTTENRRNNVTKIAFLADAAVSVAFKTPADAPPNSGPVRITLSLKNGMALMRADPILTKLDARLKVWWDTKSGVLKVSFSEMPTIDIGNQLRLFGQCGLARWATDWLTSNITSVVLGRFDDKTPIAVPLAVPVAMRITEVAADEEDSLAALPGLVRQAARVLNGLTNPLVVDNVVPRAAFRLAKGIVIMTNVRAGAALLSGGMGSGLLMRKMPTGRWSGPASIGTVTAAVGIQIGWRKTDTLLILPTDYHVEIFQQALDGAGQIKIGATLAVAAGPVGRDAAVDARIGQGGAAVCLSYSHSQGVFMGWNVEGEVLVGRQTDNEEYYYTEGVTAEEILDGIVAPPDDEDARKLYEILDDLSSGTEDDVAANVVAGAAGAATRGVASGAAAVGQGAANAANTVGWGLTNAASAITTFGGTSMSLVGRPARVSELTHPWEGSYTIVSAFIHGVTADRVLRFTFYRSGPEEDALLLFTFDSKHGAFFQPDGVLAEGTCVVHAKLKAEGDERLVFDTQFGRHIVAWVEDGKQIWEQNDNSRSERPETAPGGCFWDREDEFDVTAPKVAVASELKFPWVGLYERHDGAGVQKDLQLKLSKRGDGSGIVGYKFITKNSGILGLAPVGVITGGVCNVIEITPKLRPGQSAPARKSAFEVGNNQPAAKPAERRKSLFEFGSSNQPVVEERLVFESRFGKHTLSIEDGGKTIVEENINGRKRSVMRWTREEPAEGKEGKEGKKGEEPKASLW